MEADGTDMGGHLSHEYHYLTSIGEQKLQFCSDCGEISVEPGNIDNCLLDNSKCPKCNSNGLSKKRGIEVSALAS